MKDRLFSWLNYILVADVFLVIFGFIWLAIAVIGRTSGFPLGLDLWYKLWQPVFTPAITILIVGAIASGMMSWISRKFMKTGNG